VPDAKRSVTLRWRIGTLLAGGVLINYFDRISLSVAGPQLAREFQLTPVDMGLLLSAFFWSYALVQIPAGLLLDRFGVRRIGSGGALLWAVASVMGACAGGYLGILLARLLLGIAEAPIFPANAKATGYWFARTERGRSTALFDAAAKFSNVIRVPIVAYAVVHWGWRYGFGVVAALSFAYFLVFSWLYHDPSRHPRLGREEREYLAAGGAAPESAQIVRPARLLGYLLCRRKVWGLSLGFGAYGYCFYLFLTWLPAYLVQSMHMTIMQSAGFAAVPWTCATLADLFVGGWLIDFLIAKKHDETRVRKSVLLIGMCAGLAVFGAATTTNPIIAITWISIALSGLAAAAPVGWSLPALIAPQGGVATVGSIMNLANNVMGAIAPAVTGWLLGGTQSFHSAFLVAGMVLMVGIGAFAFLLGRIESLPGPAPLRAAV